MSKYDEVLKPFTAAMDRELHANASKGDRPGWMKMSAATIMLEILYHHSKLQVALDVGDGDRILEHTADVANLSMMLADVCGALSLAPAAPTPAAFTNDDLIAIARTAAVGSPHRYSYMPTVPEDAAGWEPHYWVIEAMRALLQRVQGGDE